MIKLLDLQLFLLQLFVYYFLFLLGKLLSIYVFLFKRVYFSSVTALFIYVSYLLGFVVSWLLLKYQNKTDVYLHQLTNIYHEHLRAKKRVIKLCSICDDLSCRRHQKSKSITPWKHLLINENLNSATEHVSSYQMLITYILAFILSFSYMKELLKIS